MPKTVPCNTVNAVKCTSCLSFTPMDHPVYAAKEKGITINTNTCEATLRCQRLTS